MKKTIVSLRKRRGKSKNETIVFKNDRFFKSSFFKNCRFLNDRYKKRSFKKTIVFKKFVVLLTIVTDYPSLTIVNDYPLLTIVNDYPSLTTTLLDNNRKFGDYSPSFDL